MIKSLRKFYRKKRSATGQDEYREKIDELPVAGTAAGAGAGIPPLDGSLEQSKSTRHREQCPEINFIDSCENNSTGAASNHKPLSKKGRKLQGRHGRKLSHEKVDQSDLRPMVDGKKKSSWFTRSAPNGFLSWQPVRGGVERGGGVLHQLDRTPLHPETTELSAGEGGSSLALACATSGDQQQPSTSDSCPTTSFPTLEKSTKSTAPYCRPIQRDHSCFMDEGHPWSPHHKSPSFWTISEPLPPTPSVHQLDSLDQHLMDVTLKTVKYKQGSKFTVFGDAAFQREFLDIHNSIRRLHGAPDMVWCPELACEAEQWAHLVAEKTRVLYREKPEIGENVDIIRTNGADHLPTSREIIETWTKPAQNYDFQNPKWIASKKIWLSKF